MQNDDDAARSTLGPMELDTFDGLSEALGRLSTRSSRGWRFLRALHVATH